MLDLMTSSRKVRTTKVRVCAYFALILLVCALAALYANARLQYEEIQKSYHLCKQEKESLSTKFQAIYDYKQRLDKSLKTEKADHQRTKSELEGKLNDEKVRYEKIISEEKLRFSTLQQHHNILQTHEEDLKEECSKTQKDQLDEINTIQAKLKEVQEELKKSENDKDNSIAHLKTKNEVLQNQVERLKVQLKKPDDKFYSRVENSTIHFSKLVKDGQSHYSLGENSQQEQTRVLAVPKNAIPVINVKSSSPRSPDMNIDGMNLPPFPVTSSTTKRSTSKESRFETLAVAKGIDVPERSDDHYSNIAAPMQSAEKENKLQNSLNNHDEIEDEANEMLDTPNKGGDNHNMDEDDDTDDGNHIPNGDVAERH